MMSKKHSLMLLALAAAGCDSGVAATNTKSKVTLTSVAFADDCGGTPPQQAPASPPPAAAAPARRAPADVAASEPMDQLAVKRRCEQTAMQLAITSDVATDLQIKSVEVFDEKGKSLGKLTASKPTRWDAFSSAYEPWDQKVVTGQMSVSYVLSQPVFVDQWDSRDRTYKVKVVAALGGKDQPLQTTVLVVGRPPPVPT